MARGLILMIPGEAHLNPTIGLVNELIKQDHEIVYITSNRFKDTIERTKATFVGYPEEVKENVNSNNANINLMNMSKKFMEGNKLILDLAMKQSGEFDYIIYDSYMFIDDSLIKKFNIKKLITTTTTFALDKKLFSHMLNNFDIHKVGTTIHNKIKSDQLIDNKISIKKHKANLNIVFTSKYLQPNSNEFDKTYKFIGPAIIKDKSENFKIEKQNNKKLVYISLGSVVSKNLEFYKKCFKALGNSSDLNVIVSVGRRISISELGDIPYNFKVYNYVPQFEVLKQSDLLITHGSMNSSNEALYNDIPLLIIPQLGDQTLIAKRIEELGAAIVLSNDVNESTIKNSVEILLSHSLYKESAKNIGQSLREAGGCKEATNFINQLL